MQTVAIFDYSVPSFLKNGSEHSARLFSWLSNTMSSAKFALENLDSDNFSDISSVKSEILGDTASQLAQCGASVAMLTSSLNTLENRVPQIQSGRSDFTVTQTQTVYEITVNFTETFDTVPVVTVSAVSSTPQYVSVSCSSVSKTSFVIRYYTTKLPGGNKAHINWTAIGK